MKITKLYCPFSEYWRSIVQSKYGFETYDKSIEHKKLPVIVFGCYGGATKSDIMNHEGLCVVVWSGSDSVRLHEHPSFVKYCQSNAHRVFHIAHSHWIQTDLAHFGLKHIDKVIVPTNSDVYSFEKEAENYVYHYGTHQRMWYYGTEIINKIEKKWGQNMRYPGIIKTVQTAYSKKELYDKYKASFVGVRLTEHDNMAMSVVEMGLMGRRSIFNGNVPCAIPYPCPPYDRYEPLTRKQWVWQDESLVGIIEKMILDYWGTEPDRIVAEEMREFVYDNEDWLDTKYYE